MCVDSPQKRLNMMHVVYLVQSVVTVVEVVAIRLPSIFSCFSDLVLGKIDWHIVEH